MPLVDIAHVENQSFDYIIIEDAKTSVLVLEAGNTNENDPAICRPAQWGSHFGQDAYSWSHATVPQKHAADRSIGLFRGRGLGGSSSINFSAWLQPQKHDIDGRLGKVGKCRMELWKILQICFSRYIASRQLLLVISYLSGFRYKAREVAVPGVTDDWSPPVSFTKTVPDFDVKFHQTLMMVQSMINAGMPRAKAPLTGDVSRISCKTADINHRPRKPYGAFFSTNSLDPVTNTRSYAGSVVLSDVHGEQVATGVEFMFSTEDQVRVVHANKEVILSAGTLKTPQILELSGIGRKTVLEQFGIPTLIDLPVGENIQEHVYVGVSVQLKDDIPDATLDELSIDGGLQKHLDLFTQGKGVFTMGLSNFAFFPLSDVSSRAKEIREAGIATSQRKIESGEYPIGAVTSLQMQANKLLRPALDCEITTMPAFLSGPNVPAAMKKHFTIFAMSNHTLSRGTIHLKSKDPRVDPAYDPCYFENPAASDLELLIELFKYIRKVTQLAPFKDCLDSEVNPGPNVQTDEQIRDWIKQTFSTTFHTIGACSMLPRAKGGVVDSSLKVYGCQNLRVVDISIAPLHVSAHTQTLAYAIAEQGAKVDFSVLNTVS
ncbi:GMC oxidoreductase [Mycena galericulata]|nr:GMC oxidoreductase [Mycena galericulata]